MGCSSSSTFDLPQSKHFIFRHLRDDYITSLEDQLFYDQIYLIKNKLINIQKDSIKSQQHQINCQIKKYNFNYFDSKTQLNKQILMVYLNNQFFKILYKVSQQINIINIKNSFFQNQKWIQILIIFYKNGKKQAPHITFQKFLINYSLLTQSNPQTKQFLQILFIFLSKNDQMLQIKQLYHFFNLIQIDFNNLNNPNNKLYEQFKTNELINGKIDKIIGRQKFIQIFTTFQQYFIINLFEFQKIFSLINKQEKINIDKPYFDLKQLIIQNQMNDYYKADQFVYLLPKKSYVQIKQIIDKNCIFRQKRAIDKQTFEKKQNNKFTSTIKIKYSSQSNKIISTKQLKITQNPDIQKIISIDYSQIEDEYQFEIKQNINHLKQIQVINQKLFKSLQQLFYIKPKQIKRKVNKSLKIQFLPHILYLYKTYQTGQINYQTKQIIYVYNNQTLNDLNFKKRTQNYFKDSDSIHIFTKLFDQKNYREQSNLNIQISTLIFNKKRIVIVITTNKLEFIKKNTRKQINTQNLTVGDKVYCYNEFQRNYLQAYIQNLIYQKNINYLHLHFIGRSYSQQTIQPIQSIYLKELNSSNQQISKYYQHLFKGLYNIGNTCYLNSSIQCLYSTHQLSRRIQFQPIYKNGFSKIIQKMFIYANKNIHNFKINHKVYDQKQFKKQICKFLPQYNGFYQHDAQQFIQSILNKISEENQKFIQNIFQTTIQSQLQCKKCSYKKMNKQNLLIISLPIYQQKYIYVQIIIIPIYRDKIQKIIIKLEKHSKISQLLNKFQQRSGYEKDKVIFCEIDNGVIKNVRKDINNPLKQNLLLNDLAIVTNIQLVAYEFIKEKKIHQIISKSKHSKGKKHYYDLFIKQKKIWAVAKIENTENDPIQIQYLNQKKQVIKSKIPKAQIQTQKYIITELDKNTFTQKDFLQIYHRKMSSQSVQNKYPMQKFGIQMLLTIHPSSSYNQIIFLINLLIQNLKATNNLLVDQDYIVRFVEPVHYQCIFCQKNTLKYFQNSQSLKRCCKVLEADSPIYWVVKKSNFIILIDWKNINKYNSRFFSQIIMDNMCKLTGQQCKKQKISLKQCFSMLRIKQEVTMNCDQCSYTQMTLQQCLYSLPAVLIIQLKQFRYTNYNKMVKLNTNLDYKQIKQIDISAYLSQNSYLKNSINFSGIYQLYGIIKHYGSGNSGHYTAICKKYLKQYNKFIWVQFDDSMTKIIKDQEIHQEMNNVYILFYRKKYLPPSIMLKLNLI